MYQFFRPNDQNYYKVTKELHSIYLSISNLNTQKAYLSKRKDNLKVILYKAPQVKRLEELNKVELNSV
jgi:hypothetical protein